MMRRRLHCRDHRFSGELALQTAELLRRNDDNLITTMHGHVLRPLAERDPRNFAAEEVGLLEDVMSVLLLSLALALHFNA